MPGLYRDGDFDLAGTIVGVVEEDAALHGHAIVPGDLLVGLASSGLHTNGYSLARRILFDVLRLAPGAAVPELGCTAAEALLAVHRSYADALRPVLGRVHGLAHITGGGIPGNLVRVLPEGAEAVVDAASWAWPPLFRLLAAAGKVSDEEMRDVFNLGIGMIAVAPPGAADLVRASARDAGVASWIIGAVQSGPRGVRFR